MFNGPPLEEFVPLWVLWGQLFIVPFASYLIVYLLCRWTTTIAAGPRPLPEMSKWWLRAERFEQAGAARFIVILIAAAIISLLTSLMTSPLSNVTTGVRLSLAGIAVVAAAYSARAAVYRDMLGRAVSAWSLMRDHFLTLAVFGYPFYLIALLAGFVMPAEYSAVTIAWLVGLVALGIALRYGGSIWLLRATRALIPAPQRARDAVAAVGGESASVYELRVGHANAFAFPTQNSVAFTTRFLEICTDEELEAVSAHEVAHLCDPNMQRSMKLSWAGLAMILLLVQLRPAAATWGSAGKNAIFAAAAVFVIYRRIKGRGILTRGEEHADSEATKHADPAIYARALEKLYRDRLGTVGEKSWGGHASLFDRMTTTGVQPEFERPPSKLPAIARPRVMVAAIVPAMVFGLLAVIALTTCRVVRHSIDEPSAQLAYSALTGDTALDALDIAEAAAERGQIELVRPIVRRVVERSPDDALVWASAAGVLTLARFDDDGDAALALARRIVADEVEQDILDDGEVATYLTAAAEYVDDIEQYIQSVRASRPHAATP